MTGLLFEPDSVRRVTERDMDIAFQPIVRFSDGVTIAHEALARCTLSQFSSPAELFARASAEEACGRLGRVVRNVLFERCQGMPVFINLHPQELRQRWLVQPTDPLYLHDAPVYLEVTEAAAFENLELCMSVLAAVKERCNASLVVDDFGAGHSDMDRVLSLKPEVVKLDMSLVRGLQDSPERRAHLSQVVASCRAVGAELVAEGIETEAELAALQEFDIQYGQGYLFGRPSTPPTQATWPPAMRASHQRLRRR